MTNMNMRSSSWAGALCCLLTLVKGYPYLVRIATPRQAGALHDRCLRATPVPSDRGELNPPADNLLDQLQRHTTIWADTADVETVERLAKHGVVDVTTNPSIVSATALGMVHEESALLIQAHVESGEKSTLESHERIAVALGCRLLEAVPGRVCTQLDIRLTDTGAMVAKARDLVAAYTKAGVAKERILIKTPATWAGIRATERLEREGIKCLVTLVCSQIQGRAAAEAGASIIATYVGRVSDWHKTAKGAKNIPASAEEDPGVMMTSDLKNYFVAQDLATEVMAASFRSVDQIIALSGCDHLTIGPGFIEKMAGLPPAGCLSGSRRAEGFREKYGRSAPPMDEEAFQSGMDQDACGTDVLRSSVLGFTRDTLALEAAMAAHGDVSRPQQ